MFLLGYIFSILAVLTSANADGHCIMRGSCGIDETTGLIKPCVYDGNAVPLDDPVATSLLKSLCPDLKAGPNFAVCCDAEQVGVFNTQLDTLASLFKRCPSCYHNLANLFCQGICSVNQSLFLEVTASSNNSVDKINYYITEYFATGLFDSCKNVQLSFTSSRAIDILCGSHSTDCTPHLWLKYMGGHDPSPYEIDFHYETSDTVTVDDVTFYPMNRTIIPCSQAVSPDSVACSCVDCPCNPEPPPPPPKEKTLFGLRRMVAIMLIIYIALAALIIGGFVCNSCHKREDDEELLIAGGEKWEKNPSLCEQWGAALDNWLKKIFTKWATFCASHPFFVLFMGLLFVLGFCTGLIFFTVVTNPVELWSAPTSQAREEKDYFDKHFG